jgi:hypothetical protein
MTFPMVVTIMFFCTLSGAKEAYRQAQTGQFSDGLPVGCMMTSHPVEVQATKLIQGPAGDWEHDLVALVEIKNGAAYTVVWNMTAKRL